MERARDFSPETLRVENALRDVSWQLLERQIDFDYIDEKLLQSGKIKQGQLRYRDREYRAIVFPAVTVLERETMRRLEELAQNGVSLIFLGGIPDVARETGEPCDFASRMMRYRGQANFYSSADVHLPGMTKIPALPRQLLLTPARLECVLTGAEGAGKIVDGEVLSDAILSHLRVDGDTRILFLTNMGGKPYEGSIALRGATHVQMANPMDGTIEEIHCAQEGELCKIPVRLKPYAGVGYRIHAQARASQTTNF